jgi:hypothetical protein
MWGNDRPANVEADLRGDILMPSDNRSPHPVADVLVMIPRLVTLLVAITMAAAIALAGQQVGQQVAGAPATRLALVAEPFDPEVVLPVRVDAALHRTFSAVERAVVAVDDRDRAHATNALHAATVGFKRAEKAVLHQVLAVSDPEAEEESTAGPDSALAALNVAQVSIGQLEGLFDGIRGVTLVRAIGKTLRAAQIKRAELLGVLVGLDPEGAGAAYADALADTVPAYTDEVASIQEALADDWLTATARSALQGALARSQAAEVAITAAYGGGE